jgi:hypothetical protein
MDLGISGFDVKSIAVDPTNTQRVYVITPEALYKTEDGGGSWTLAMDGMDFTSPTNVMMSIAVNPAFPGTLFVAFKNINTHLYNKVYRSVDYAGSWQELFFPGGGWYPWDGYDIEIDPKNTNNVYLAAETYVLASDSNGDPGSWHTMFKHVGADIRDMAIDPSNPSRLLVASRSGDKHGGVFFSSDGGSTWKQLGAAAGLVSNKINAVVIDPVNPMNVYAGTHDDTIGVFHSANGGISWSRMDSGFPDYDTVNDLAVDPETGGTLLAAARLDGIYRYTLLAPVAEQAVPSSFTVLRQNRPNPFNPHTSIAFELARESAVRLRIYDCQGQLVRILVEDVLPRGEHEAIWDGTDRSGKHAAAGVYFCRMEADGVREMVKMVLTK